MSRYPEKQAVPSPVDTAESESEKDPAALVRQRIDRILYVRLPVAAWMTIAAEIVSTIVNATLGNTRTAMASLTAASIVAATLIALQRRRIGEHRSAMLVFLLWLVLMADVLVSSSEAGPAFAALWIAILIVGHSVVQLRPSYGWSATVLGCAAWLYLVAGLDSTPLALHLLSISFALAIVFTVFRSNRLLVDKLELMAEIDSRRSRQLALALQSAEHELSERRQAELEAERLRERFVQSQRLEAIGNLAGGMAHDMNNVLSSIATVNAMVAETVDERHRADLQVIREACERGAALTQSLLGFSRRAQYRKERLDLGSAANDAVRLLTRTLRKQVHLEFEPGDRVLLVEADRNHLVQVILNLCINAERAIAARGTIRIYLGRELLEAKAAEELTIAPGWYATFSVIDNGCGMDEETRARAFEPFFTTQPVGKGAELPGTKGERSSLPA